MLTLTSKISLYHYFSKGSIASGANKQIRIVLVLRMCCKQQHDLAETCGSELDRRVKHVQACGWMLVTEQENKLHWNLRFSARHGTVHMHEKSENFSLLPHRCRCSAASPKATVTCVLRDLRRAHQAEAERHRLSRFLFSFSFNLFSQT